MMMMMIPEFRLRVFQIAMNILNSGRFSMGSSATGVIKKLISKNPNTPDVSAVHSWTHVR